LPRLLQSLDVGARAEAVLLAAPYLGRHDPSAAAAAVLTLPEEKSRESALHAITETVAIRGANDGLVWVQALPRELQSAATGGLVSTLAVHDPSLAAEIVAVWVEAGRMMPELPVVTLSREWATGEPSEAAAWAASLPTSPAQEYALRAVAVTWSMLDAEAARDWIESWPESRVKYECEKLIPTP